MWKSFALYPLSYPLSFEVGKYQMFFSCEACELNLSSHGHSLWTYTNMITLNYNKQMKIEIEI